MELKLRDAAPLSTYRPQGATALENVVVLMVIAVLLVSILPAFGHLISHLRDSKVRLAGQAFLQSMSILHEEWRIHNQQDVPTQGIPGEGKVRLSAVGWPEGTNDAARSSGLHACLRIWQALMQDSDVTITTDPEGDADFLATHPAPGLCIYRYQSMDSDTHTRLLIYQVGTANLTTVIH
ncbi:MAG: hypothetical protein HKM02_08580 [Pseudomonadales bacterium]|nr:hypothetical protein [Pseudomonadales bacterium]